MAPSPRQGSREEESQPFHGRALMGAAIVAAFLRRIAAPSIARAAGVSLFLRVDESAALLWRIAAIAGRTAIRRLRLGIPCETARLRRIAAVGTRNAAIQLRAGATAAQRTQKQSQRSQ